MNKEKINICSTQDLARYIIQAGEKGTSIKQIQENTTVCSKSWDTERYDFIEDQLNRLVKQGHVMKKDDVYVISEEWLTRTIKGIMGKNAFVSCQVDGREVDELTYPRCKYNKNGTCTAGSIEIEVAVTTTVTWFNCSSFQEAGFADRVIDYWSSTPKDEEEE